MDTFVLVKWRVKTRIGEGSQGGACNCNPKLNLKRSNQSCQRYAPNTPSLCFPFDIWTQPNLEQHSCLPELSRAGNVANRIGDPWLSIRWPIGNLRTLYHQSLHAVLICFIDVSTWKNGARKYWNTNGISAPTYGDRALPDCRWSCAADEPNTSVYDIFRRCRGWWYAEHYHITCENLVHLRFRVDGENVELDAIRALQYEGSRAEVALGFKENGNEMVKLKRWKDGKEFYTQALGALRGIVQERRLDLSAGVSTIEAPSTADKAAEILHEKQIEEACYINRALCNLELRTFGS